MNQEHFPQMRRFRQQLSEEACIELLKRLPRGFLAMAGENGYPYSIPLNFYFDEEKKTIYFHGAKAGYKNELLKKQNKVCFSLIDEGSPKEGDWALYFNSVVVFGSIRVVENERKAVSYLRLLGNKYNPSPADVEAEIEKLAARTQMLELTIDHMTGKRVLEK